MPEHYRYSLPVKAGDQRQLGELTGAACATLVAEIAERHPGPVVLVAPDMQNALRLNDEIRQFTDSMVTGLAIWMNPYVTDVLNERTTLPQYVEKKCLETFENNEFLSGENQDVQKKWLESMGVPEELVNQILGSGAVQEYQEEQLHSLASYAAKAVSEKIMKGIAFFLTLVLAVVFVTIAVKIVELIAEIPGISFLNRMGGAGLGVVRAVLWIWIFFAVVYCFQATHWGNVCMKQIQGDMALAWIRENNPVLMLLKNVL